MKTNLISCPKCGKSFVPYVEPVYNYVMRRWEYWRQKVFDECFFFALKKAVEANKEIQRRSRKMTEFFSGDEIVALTDLPKGRYFKRAPEYGARAWILEGRKRTLIVWDEGNDWCSILTQIARAQAGCALQALRWTRKNQAW